MLFAAQAVLGAGAGLMRRHAAGGAAVVRQGARRRGDGGVPDSRRGAAPPWGAPSRAPCGGAWCRGSWRRISPEAAKGEAARIYASVVVACSFPWGGAERRRLRGRIEEAVTVLLWVALGCVCPLGGRRGSPGGESGAVVGAWKMWLREKGWD